MTIKHLVLSGGGYKGLQTLGALKHLENINFYNIDDIETIHCVSAGSVISLFLYLKINLKDVIHYAIHRPWEKLFTVEMKTILNLYNKKGLFNIDIFFKLYEVFFKNNNIDKNITLKQLYEISNIELHIYAVNYSKFELEDFSYITQPDLKVIDAIYMSSTLPFIFEPLKYNNSYYIDGGIKCYYPLEHALKSDISKNEILGIRINDTNFKNYIKDDDNVVSYGFDIINKLIKQNINYEKKIKNQIVIFSKKSNSDECSDIINDPKKREEYILEGEKFAKLFYEYIIKELY